MGIFERIIKDNYRKNDKKNKITRQILKTTNSRRAAIFVALYVISLLIMGSGYISRSQSIVEGEPSPSTILSSSEITYESQILTMEAVEQAISTISPVMVVDREALVAIEDEIKAIFSNIVDIREDYQSQMNSIEESEDQEPGLEDPYAKIDMNQYAFFDLGKGELEFIITSDDIEIEMIEEYSVGLVRKYMEAGVQASGIEIARQNMLEEVMSSTLPSQTKSLISTVVREITLIETLYYDDTATSVRKEEVIAAVSPVKVTISKDEVLVGEGEIVDALTYEKILATNTSIRDEIYLGVWGIAIILLILYGIIIWFLFHYRPEVPEHESYLLLLAVLIVFGIMTGEIFAQIALSAARGGLFFYMAPIAAVGILTTILLDNETGLMVSTIIAVLLGITSGLRFEYALVGILSAYIGVFSVAKVGHRRDLMKSAVYIGAVNMVTILSLGWLLNYSGPVLLFALGMGFAGGFVSSVLSIGVLPYFEMLFKITTPVKLLELSDPNQPLLRRLLMEAPGTYHHSIVVSNLSEAAAEAVGADRLLARVGAYYHDIGKLKRPYFFIENQVGLDENPHEKLSPRLSTLIITSHVKDGLELADEHRLPPSVKQFISTHHGDSVVRFFFNKATEVEGPDIKENEFRYDGKKPVSKEAAIVMLADTVEASVRSLKNANLGRIEGFVRKIIKEKFEDGQLSESRLTFKELEEIAKAFIRILSGVHHQRIEYPEKLAKEIERRKDQNGANSNQQSARNPS